MTETLELSRAEFLAIRSRIALIVSLVRETDEDALDAFVRQCDTADTLGPLLDPTLWMRGHDQLAVMRQHARAFAAFRSDVGGSL